MGPCGVEGPTAFRWCPSAGTGCAGRGVSGTPGSQWVFADLEHLCLLTECEAEFILLFVKFTFGLTLFNSWSPRGSNLTSPVIADQFFKLSTVVCLLRES